MMMLRYSLVLIALMTLIPAAVMAQEAKGGHWWNKPAGNEDSQKPYTVTAPGTAGQWSLKNLLPWHAKTQKPAQAPIRNITALPKTIEQNVSTEPRSADDLRARDQKEWAAQSPALEKMRIENLEKAAALDKQHEALLKKLQKQQVAAPAAATPVKTPQDRPPKSVYTRPGTPKPPKVFPGGG